MASLLSKLRDGKCLNTDGGVPPAAFEEIIRLALHHETIHVNAQAIVDSYRGRVPKADLREDLEDVTPPFANMWIEHFLAGNRIACLFQRFEMLPEEISEFEVASSEQKYGDGPYRHKIQIWIFIEVDGRVNLLGLMFLVTDEFGQIAFAPRFRSFSVARDVNLPATFSSLVFFALEAIVRMNTQGTILVRIPGQQRRPCRLRPLEAAACVWHEVVITPEIIVHTGEAVSMSSEAAERREYWVRACRRDYRKGRGLFGLHKALVWIPEHKRGNPDLGSEIPEFRIKTEIRSCR